MKVVPITQKSAFAWVKEKHRHHIAPQGSVFQIAVEVTNGYNERRIAGVAIVGRPVARNNNDGLTLEVTRLCTDGYYNACSFLYSACWRVAKEMGYNRLITYILESEPGTSPRAAGWHKTADTKGGSWSRDGRHRTDKHPIVPKQRFEINRITHNL
jgi:hypothetical protein